MIWLDTSGYPCSWWTYGASAHRGHRQCPHLPFCGSACVFLELLDSIGRADPQARRNGFYWDIASGVSAAGHCEESQGRSQGQTTWDLRKSALSDVCEDERTYSALKKRDALVLSAHNDLVWDGNHVYYLEIKIMWFRQLYGGSCSGYIFRKTHKPSRNNPFLKLTLYPLSP